MRFNAPVCVGTATSTFILKGSALQLRAIELCTRFSLYSVADYDKYLRALTRLQICAISGTFMA